MKMGKARLHENTVGEDDEDDRTDCGSEAADASTSVLSVCLGTLMLWERRRMKAAMANNRSSYEERR